MRLIFVVKDARGASDTYEGYSLECREGARLVWTEGIRKDRCMMFPSMRAFVESELARLAQK